jgi:shikimate dehydrogenase
MPNTATAEFSLQPFIGNPIDPSVVQRRWIAGIIGDKPSQYAKSPILWNAAYRALGLDAIFLPWDVTEPQLKPLVQAIRENPQIVGCSVTMPYKISILKLLDGLDPKAEQIGAVNTVVRTEDGRLIGYNTDGQGAIDSLTQMLPGQKAPFLKSLQGLQAVMIGAGGAARAVAFFLAEALGPQGHLTIINRDATKATDLAQAVNKAFGNASAVENASLLNSLSKADLVINASTVGQTGMRKLANGDVTCLEPFSPLGPVDISTLPASTASDESAFYAAWFPKAISAIEHNQKAAAEGIVVAKPTAAFFDLIYAPLETRFLNTARLSGHRTLNGKGMNIAQAADGFIHKVMPRHLRSAGLDPATCYPKVFEAMAAIW